MKSRYSTQGGSEALFDEADSDFSAEDAASNTGSPSAHSGSNPATLNDSPSAGTYTTGTSMSTAEAETLGDGTDEFAEMAFSIDKVTVTARSRALKAEYTMELAQDLKAIHGLDAETELANILSSEILAKSTVKLLELSIQLLSLVHKLILLLLESSTLTPTLMVVGQLRSSKVYFTN
jgi:hypothetical protein